MASVIPGHEDAYVFGKSLRAAREYFQLLREAYFAITQKRQGWDSRCILEILASGAVPLSISDFPVFTELRCRLGGYFIDNYNCNAYNYTSTSNANAITAWCSRKRRLCSKRGRKVILDPGQHRGNVAPELIAPLKLSASVRGEVSRVKKHTTADSHPCSAEANASTFCSLSGSASATK